MSISEYHMEWGSLPIVQLCLGPGPLAWLLSHWSYSPDSKTCLIWSELRRHWISWWPASDLSIILTVCLHSLHWTIIVKTTWSWSNLNIWSGGDIMSDGQRGEVRDMPSIECEHKWTRQFMSTEIDLISNRKKWPDSGPWRVMHKRRWDCEIARSLFQLSVVKRNCSRKINYSYNL